MNYNVIEVHLVQILTYVILINSLVIVTVLVWILVNRGRMSHRQRRVFRHQRLYQELLLNYLETDDSSKIETTLNRIAAIAHNRNTRALLINVITELCQNLTGLNRQLIRLVYYNLRLNRDTIRKMNNRRWHIRIQGFKNAVTMNQHGEAVMQSLHNALGSSNKYLRMEAQLALIRLNPTDPFAFLDRLDVPFTLWEQMNACELIVRHELPVPRFARWIGVANTTVVIFSLRMIQVFRQTGAAQQVLACLDHGNEDVRREACMVCGNLQIAAALPKLRDSYNNEGYRNRLAILNTLCLIPDTSNLDFLQTVLDVEEDIQLQIAAAVAIRQTGTVGEDLLRQLMEADYKNYLILIRHVLDRRIS